MEFQFNEQAPERETAVAAVSGNANFNLEKSKKESNFQFIRRKGERTHRTTNYPTPPQLGN